MQVKNWSEPLGEADLQNIQESIDARAAGILGDANYMWIVMSVGGGGVKVNMQKKASEASGTGNAHASSTLLQECLLYECTFKRNERTNVKQVGLIVPRIDTLPETLFSAKIKRILNGVAGGIDHFERTFKELYQEEHIKILELFLEAVNHVDKADLRRAVAGIDNGEAVMKHMIGMSVKQ